MTLVSLSELLLSPLFLVGSVVVLCEALSVLFSRTALPGAYAVLGLGLLFSYLGLADDAILAELSPFIEFALAAVLFDFGRKLDLSWILSGRPALAWAGGAVIVASFSFFLSLFFGAPVGSALFVSVVSLSASPILFAFSAQEQDARGPGTNCAYSFVALGVLFSILAAPFAKILLAPPELIDASAVSELLLTVLRSALVAVAVFILFRLLRRFLRPDDESSAILLFGAILLALSSSVILAASPMLSLPLLGLLLRLFERGGGPIKMKFHSAQRVAYSLLLFATAAASPSLFSHEPLILLGALCAFLLQFSALFILLERVLPFFSRSALLVPASAGISSSASGFYLIDSALSPPAWLSPEALSVMSAYVSVSFLLVPLLLFLALRRSGEARHV